MQIAAFSSIWGSSTGGIDVFNMNLVRGLAKISGVHVCACLQQRTTALEKDSEKFGFKFVTANNDLATQEAVDEISAWNSEKAAAVWGRMKLQERFQPDYVLLHDIFCKEILTDIADWAPEAKVITFFHSAYGRSEKRKGRPDTELGRKIKYQREMIEESDLSIAVGSFSESYLKSIAPPESHQKITSLPPGLPSIQSKAKKTDRFNAISFGRLDPISDSLKQIRVAATGWTKALASKKISKLKTDDVNFFAVGARGDDSVLSDLKDKLNTWRAHLYELPFEDVGSFDGSHLQKRMEQCSFALLNSWYENFGLTYLEACTFGIPAIVSDSSGFFHEAKAILGRENVEELVTAVSVENSTEEELIEEIKLQLIAGAQAFDETFEQAERLRELILEKWPKWTEVSQQVVDLLDSIESVCSDGEREIEGPVIAPSEIEAALVNVEWSETLRDLRDWCWKDNVSYYRNMTTRHDYSSGNDFPLTTLQKSFWEAREHLIEHPFRDLVLSGGTSSGKTTLAEYLFGISRRHEFSRSRILYVAPTKALAQERAADWKEKFPTPNPRNTEFEPVIVSTGDENASDGALMRGDFNIASTVYEKANIILTAGQDLLSKLNLVVIDEFHMLDDLHRGGVVECLLAKIKIEKLRRIDSVNTDNPLRVIIITTEDPGVSISRFLSFDEDGTGVDVEPLILTDIGRAREVIHSAILPGRLQSSTPAVFEIRKFDRTDNLTLSDLEVMDLSKRLASFQHEISEIEDGFGFDSKRQRFQYQQDFCATWLRQNPKGARLLIFMSSKFDIIEFARNLKNDLRKNPVFELNDEPAEVFVNRVGIEAVIDSIDEVENTDFVQDLERCAKFGVFVHNADVPRKVRSSFEHYLGAPPPRDARSEFIIATETLSYGVNLQINDVALFSVMFPENERVPTGRPESILLSRCDFVNMAGRAGRLNQRSGPKVANVYWYLDADNERSFETVVRNFYGSLDGINSALLYKSDARSLSDLAKQRRQAQLLQEEVGGAASKQINELSSPELPIASEPPVSSVQRVSAVEKLSYPFTRSVLDCVRFLGGTKFTVGSLGKPGCTVEEAVSGFFFETLYFHQLSEISGVDKEQAGVGAVQAAGSQDLTRASQRQRVLVQAVKQVIESAAEPQYQLLNRLSSGSYQITPLGSASIDTGTEIRTVVNLRHALLSLNTAWRSYFGRELPFELAVLPAFFQPEVYRQYIARLPEFRLAMDWNPAANRDDLVSRICTHLEREGKVELGEEFSLRAVLSDYVAWTLANQPVVSDPGRYEEAPYDSCLRLYLAYLSWINGSSLRETIGEIQALYPSSGQKTESSVFNFEAFAENLTWKITFLVSLLRASSEDILPANSTFDAVRFVHRSRFGCIEQAIPLLYRNKSSAPPINRVQAHRIYRDGHTSADIALGELDGKSNFGARKERQIRNHVRKFISESFLELSRQFTYLSSGTGLGKLNEEVSKEYWAYSSKQITALLESGNALSIDVNSVGAISADELRREREELLRQEYDSSQFVADFSNDGLELSVYQPKFAADESDEIRLERTSAVKVRFSFGIPSHGEPMAVDSSVRGVVVDFPWSMGVDEATSEHIRMSPAAFGILLALCSREFVSDPARYLDTVIGYSGSQCIGARSLYSISQRHLKMGGFPEGLFDAWAKYIEVGESQS